MSLPVGSKKIGDVLYTFSMLPASKAMEVWSSIESFVVNPGNSLSAIAAVGGKQVQAIAAAGMPPHEKEELIATVTMLSALSALPEGEWTTPDGRRMNGRQRIIAILLSNVSVGGQPVDVDTNFTGRLKVLYQVLGEAMRFNFADFFSGLAAVTDSLLSAAKPA